MMMQGALAIGQCGSSVNSAGAHVGLVAAPFRPFPILLPTNECLLVRTILPHDGEQLQDYVRGLSSESRRNRFLGALSEYTPARLEELIRMRGPRQVLLLALTQIGSKFQMVAEAMLVIGPKSERGEIALSVADNWQRRGLGSALIRHLEARAWRAGARYLFGDVLRTNTAMKGLARKSGFSICSPFTDARLVEIVKDLAPASAHPIRQAG
jgi:GNAT superfamily N-acetyltransferase